MDSLSALNVPDYETKYDLTKKRHDDLKDLMSRHVPQLLDSKAMFDHQKLQNLEDEFELIEIDENEMKHEMHKDRAFMPLADILTNLRERISFFGVYHQVDNINKNKLMIKKIKY